MRQCALLLIKGRNEHHDTMQISQAPISFEDLQEAYVRLLDGRRSDEVFDWKEGDARERRFLRYSFLDDDHMQEYIQTGYASDMDTMILPEESIIVRKKCNNVTGRISVSKNTVRKKITGRQLMPGIFISLAISFLLFLYAPIDLYCANTAEFWFDFSTLLITALGMFAACFAVLAVLYLIAMLIHPYVYRITLAGGIALFICTYIQGNFMIDRLPPLDGTSIWWGKYDILRKDTLLLWVVVLIVVIAAMIVLRKQKFVHVVMFISGCMTLMLLVTACSTVITSGALHSKLHLHVSVEEEFEMSADNNFVILVLDTADSREFTSLLEEHPEYREIFGDFTYFENTTGAYTSTLNAIPFILSGEWYENEGSFQDYLDRVYREAPLWKELKSRNYQIDLYEDDIRAQDASIVDNFDNVYFTKVTPVSYLELAKQELKLVGFRYAPYDLKRYCVIKEVYFNELRESHPEGSDSKAFTADNTAFKEDLAAQGVVMDETGNRFKFIHLNGAHAPFIYDKDANVIGVEQDLTVRAWKLHYIGSKLYSGIERQWCL